MSDMIPSGLMTKITKALSESMTVNIMVKLAQNQLDRYDLRNRTGYPASVPIPNREAARQIVKDMAHTGRLPAFVCDLIYVHHNAFHGRKYQIPYLRDIVVGFKEIGFLYDSANNYFIENPQIRVTQNWGFLVPGEQYSIALFWLDIVDNSRIVRNNQSDSVSSSYNEVMQMITQTVLKRNGRLWKCEGDGVLAAFFFANKETLAATSSIEILHNLMLFNLFQNTLKDPIQVRIGLAAGQLEYHRDIDEIRKQPLVQRAISIEEKHTASQSLTMGRGAFHSLDPVLTTAFTPLAADGGKSFYNYSAQEAFPWK